MIHAAVDVMAHAAHDGAPSQLAVWRHPIRAKYKTFYTVVTDVADAP
tara:strand:+ start:464 stop:604 length:141 start_codon:yes stop_codon:yes gene_type:complete